MPDHSFRLSEYSFFDSWCGSRNRERWSPLWRPFEGELSTAAQRQAITILGNLYGFLVDQNYLMGNPWSSVAVARAPGEVNAGRSFTTKQWAFIEEELRELDETSANHRLRVALHLLYATGLRLSEVVSARVDDLRWVEYPSDAQDDEPLEGYVLRVIGKGQREREVPVPTGVVQAINDYLTSRGLPGGVDATANAKAYLLGHSSDIAERAPGLTRGKVAAGRVRRDCRDDAL